MDNFIVSKYTSHGLKKISFVDTASLDTYRTLAEFANEIFIDEVKLIAYRDGTAIPLYVLIDCHIPEEKFQDITAKINAFEPYLKDEYNESTPGYVEGVNCDSYLELCDKYLY